MSLLLWIVGIAVVFVAIPLFVGHFIAAGSGNYHED